CSHSTVPRSHNAQIAPALALSAPRTAPRAPPPSHSLASLLRRPRPHAHHRFYSVITFSASYRSCRAPPRAPTRTIPLHTPPPPARPVASTRPSLAAPDTARAARPPAPTRAP